MDLKILFMNLFSSLEQLYILIFSSDEKIYFYLKEIGTEKQKQKKCFTMFSLLSKELKDKL